METAGVEDQNLDVNASPSDVDPEIVDAGQREGKPEKPKLTDAEKALAKARDDNAEKLRQERERSIRLEAELNALKNKPEPEPEYDPDMPMTYGEYQALEKKREERERKTQADKQTQEFQIRVKKSVDQTRTKYKDSEYNYDWALNYALEHFPEDDIRGIMAMSNPAQRLYDLVMLQDENRDKINSGAIKNTLNQINKNLNSPGTLSEVGGSNRTIDQIKQYDKLSGRDFVSKMDEIIASKQ